MNTEPTELLRYAPPYDDESLAGYLLRLAEINYYESPNWILQSAGLKANRGIELFDERASFTLSRLSQLVKIDKERFLVMATGATTRFKQCQYVIYNFARKLCPLCLKKALYCRRLWDIKQIQACPFHGCQLVQICSRCRQAIKWSRPGVSRCQCGFDFRDSPAVLAPLYQINLSLYFYGLEGDRDCERAFQASYGADNPIFELTHSQFIQICKFLSSFLRGFQTEHKGLFSSEFKNKDLDKYGLVLDFFKQWQDNFPPLLNWYEGQLSTNTHPRSWLPHIVDFIVILSSYFSENCPLYKYLCDYLFKLLKRQGIKRIEIIWLSQGQRKTKSLLLKNLKSWLPSVAEEFHFPNLYHFSLVVT